MVKGEQDRNGVDGWGLQGILRLLKAGNLLSVLAIAAKTASFTRLGNPKSKNDGNFIKMKLHFKHIFLHLVLLHHPISELQYRSNDTLRNLKIVNRRKCLITPLTLMKS